MIYICKGCGELCQLPCKACDACCKAISESCKCVGDLFRPICDGPLASYVLATWLCMIMVAAAGGYGIADSECDRAKQACIAFVALAVVHAVFAFYLQRQIMSGLVRKGAHPSSHEELAKEAVHILLYDVGVCFYTLIYFGSFGFACYSFAMLSCGAGAGWGAAVLLVLYGWLALTYLMAWYCCRCCAANVLPKQVQKQQQQQPQQPSAPEV
mmetsp:Transcript_13497/g.38931  ORF Transcript_13497/g.38931 Transcript_13497/m.38931 type:complete len:212 (-) Transcript_13497:454-1089(-)